MSSQRYADFKERIPYLPGTGILWTEYDAYKTEYSEQKLLRSVDTADIQKYSLIWKKESGEFVEIAGYERKQAVIGSKRQFLLCRFRKSCCCYQAVWGNGYAFILEKDVLHVYPRLKTSALVKKGWGFVVYSVDRTLGFSIRGSIIVVQSEWIPNRKSLG